MSQPAPRIPPSHGTPPPDPSGGRRLPALGLPGPRERGKGAILVSVLVHAAIIAALLIPAFALHTDATLREREHGGGPGPAGGGGGGTRGTGGALVPERVRFIHVTPTPVPTPTTLPPVTPPPVQQKPVVTPPPVVPLPTTQPQPAEVKPAPVTAAPSVAMGANGGSGSDGTAGTGPGSGGGVGSGIGTGRGSSIGPGTGGGAAVNYDPQPEVVFIPPTPAPSGARGSHIVAEFDVDSTGKVLTFSFTPTRDRGYNRQLDELLSKIRFRPGTRPDGTPIRMKGQLVFDVY